MKRYNFLNIFSQTDYKTQAHLNMQYDVLSWFLEKFLTQKNEH